jgi:chromosome segregation ATPase
MDKIDKNNTNQTLDNCISIVSNTLKDATDTSIEIKTQGEQFTKMYDMTEDIKYNTKKANGILDKMLSYVGYIRNKSSKSPKKKKIKKNQIIDESTLTGEEELILEDNLFVVSITDEDKEDKLHTLYNLTKQLKEVNLGINSTLDRQNEQVDQLETKVGDRFVDIRHTNRKINKFLR